MLDRPAEEEVLGFPAAFPPASVIDFEGFRERAEVIPVGKPVDTDQAGRQTHEAGFDPHDSVATLVSCAGPDSAEFLEIHSGVGFDGLELGAFLKLDDVDAGDVVHGCMYAPESEVYVLPD